MTTYTLKPLEWKEGEDGELYANNSFVSMRVFRRPGTGWMWWYCFDEYHDEDELTCASLEDGKAAAEAHYRERLLTALEVVK